MRVRIAANTRKKSIEGHGTGKAGVNSQNLTTNRGERTGKGGGTTEGAYALLFWTTRVSFFTATKALEFFFKLLVDVFPRPRSDDKKEFRFRKRLPGRGDFPSRRNLVGCSRGEGGRY